MPHAARLLQSFLLLSLLMTPAGFSQDAKPDAAAETGNETKLNSWDRLIYVPFKKLEQVFDNQNASAVIPYGEYLELLQNYLNDKSGDIRSPDAVITESHFKGNVEKDVVRLTGEFHVMVLKEQGWARLPLQFGDAAVGQVTANDDTRTLLRGIKKGHYELLLNGSGQHTITIELLATVKTSPEHHSFRINCPAVGISDLTLTIPKPDQAIEIAPLQVLLPLENEKDDQTTIAASLGATNYFEARWNPEAGSKPIMDLLTSVKNRTSIRIEPGLIQSSASLQYEVLRGELTEVSCLAPLDAQIIDVVSSSGRIRQWKSTVIDKSHQQIRIELLTPVTDQFHVQIQTERSMTDETVQLIGKSKDGLLQGIHAGNVVRESGRLTVETDSSLTTMIRSQSGVKRTDAEITETTNVTAIRQAWEFSGTTGTLIVAAAPVEPRIAVDQAAQIIFDNDQLRLTSQLKYNVERAGVFQLNLAYPKNLTIDSVYADGMSEFNVDTTEGKLTLSLTQERRGNIDVRIKAHQRFDGSIESHETIIPAITPLDVAADKGTITVFAPQFLDVVTVDEKLTGLSPTEAAGDRKIGSAVQVVAWKYSSQPYSLSVRTAPRAAQIAASTATTARISPGIVKISNVVTFNIQNAGLDTFRIAVPESIADDVRFKAVNGRHTIQQRNKATAAEDGFITWTLTLQNEITGTVQLNAEWETRLEDLENSSESQALEISPARVLTPFVAGEDSKRKVALTQTKGEIKLQRHESLSISAEELSETIERIDIRELELLSKDGYLAFRYFSQPASIRVSVRRHETHRVVATVVSRAAVEIVTDKQPLAAYRCRFVVTSSERQRLRVDLPAGADLQTPLLNSTRTTFERARDVTADDGWDAYYVNISREATSDQEFRLAFQFRCPISEPDSFPYEGQGSKQILRLPKIGNADGGTVIQETQLAIWGPKDIAFVGEPRHWNIAGRPTWSFWNPMVSPTADREAHKLNEWIGGEGGGTEFSRQGNVTVYRTLGGQAQIQVVWWNRPFLVTVICGALLFVGFILRHTSWENRLTLTIVGCLAIALWSLNDSSETLQFVSAGVPGLIAVAGIWLSSFLFATKPDQSVDETTDNDDGSASDSDPDSPPGGDGPDEHSPAPETDVTAPINQQPPPSTDSTSPPATIVPSPEVTKLMDDLMGGRS